MSGLGPEYMWPSEDNSSPLLGVRSGSGQDTNMGIGRGQRSGWSLGLVAEHVRFSTTGYSKTPSFLTLVWQTSTGKAASKMNLK